LPCAIRLSRTCHADGWYHANFAKIGTQPLFFLFFGIDALLQKSRQGMPAGTISA
jgi:hypothetical protein